MALFRRFFYRKPPDRLLEISERVYVFDCCFSTEVLKEHEYKVYMESIVAQLQAYHPDSSFMVFNFKGEKRSKVSDILSEYDMTIMDYPQQYERCPLLPLEMIHHFLKSSESWLSLEGQQNVLLMHCERGGWPVLAFMLAGLLIYRKQYTGELKTLEMVYKQAPKELLYLFSSLNPQPSHLRYLKYISRRGAGSEWPPGDKPLMLVHLVLTILPNFNGVGGFGDIVRVYGQDPLTPTSRSSKVLFSTPRTKKQTRNNRKAESAIKFNICCRVQGDVVIECIHLDSIVNQEDTIFRVMFNTSFIQTNLLVLNREEIDVIWNVKDLFPKDFKAEVLFSDIDASISDFTVEDLLEDSNEVEVDPSEEFFEAEEIFSNADSQEGKRASDFHISEGLNVPQDADTKFEGPTLSDHRDSILISDPKLDADKILLTINNAPETKVSLVHDVKDKIVASTSQQNSSNNLIQKATTQKYLADETQNRDMSSILKSDHDDVVVTKSGEMKGALSPSIESLKNGTGRNSSKKMENVVGRKSSDLNCIHQTFGNPILADEMKGKLLNSSSKNGSECGITPNITEQNLYQKQGSDKKEPHRQPSSSAPRKPLTFHSNASSDPIIYGQRDKEKESFSRQIKPIKPKIASRWIPPKKSSDATSIHLPLHPSSSYDSSPAALAISPICHETVMDEGQEIPSASEASDNTMLPPTLHAEPLPVVGGIQNENATTYVSPLSSSSETAAFFSPMARSLSSTPPPPPPLPSSRQGVCNQVTSTSHQAPHSPISMKMKPSSSPLPPSSTIKARYSSPIPSLSSRFSSYPSFNLNTKSTSPRPRPLPPPPPPHSTTCLSSQQITCPPSSLNVKHSSLSSKVPLPPSIPPSTYEVRELQCIPSPLTPRPCPPPPPPPPPCLPFASPCIPESFVLSHLPPPPPLNPGQASLQSFNSSPPSPPPPPLCEKITHSFVSTPLKKEASGKSTTFVSPSPCQSSSKSLDNRHILTITQHLSLQDDPPPPPPCSTSGVSTHPHGKHGGSPPRHHEGLPPLSLGVPSLRPNGGPPPLPPTVGTLGAAPSSRPNGGPPPPPPPPPPPLGANGGAPSCRPNGEPLSPSSPPPPPCGTYGGAPSPRPNRGPPPPPPPPPLGIDGGSALSRCQGRPPPPFLGSHGGVPSPPLLGPSEGVPPPPPPPRPHGRAPPPPPPPGRHAGPPPLPLFGLRGSAPPPPPPHSGRSPPPPPPLGPHGGAPPGSHKPVPPRVPGAPLPPTDGIHSQTLLNTVGGARGRGRTYTGGLGSSAKRSNLKPLHWVKVTRAVQGSLWAELQKYDDAPSTSEFDVSELESLFSTAIPKKDGSGDKSRHCKSLGSKPEKVHLIDLRRANNCEIMLSKVKMPLSDMMSAALAMDESILDVDQVENLIKFCPAKEEMELLKNYTGNKENLGKCEQFFMELMKVPRIESKLRVFSFKLQFMLQISELRKSLKTVNSTCEEIRNTFKLKEVMKKILLLGNMINQGTARGSAVGFRLDSLLKLTDTRATNNKMTLMHYLCKVLASKSPQLLDFHVDLVSLESASKIQLKSLAEEMQAIVKGIEKVELELKASENDGPVSEVFRMMLREFTMVAGAEVQSLTSLYTAVGQNADALALYFGEDPARCPFEQVVATLLNFVRMFQHAHDENCKQGELEKKKVKKEAELEKAKATPKKNAR